MKSIKIIFVISGVFIQLNSYCQNDTILKDGYVNIATLKVSYSTYAFEGGDISYYTCPSCGVDSIPFAIDYVPPGDFGGVTFKLSPSLDTVFDATIIWMGTGQIYYPASFSTLDPFANSSIPTSIPNDLRYIDTDGNVMSDTSLVNRADLAWNAIDSLEITKLFADKGYESAIYLYPPRVGMFDPNVAKWIIFLYHNDIQNAQIDSYGNSPQVLLFPNPSTGMVNLNQETVISNIQDYRIYNSLGKLVDRGRFSSETYQLDLSHLNSGLYLFYLSDEKKRPIAVEKLIIDNSVYNMH
jgi:hypothetical protein